MIVKFQYIQDNSLNLDKARDELIKKCLTLNPDKSIKELATLLTISESTLYRHLLRMKIKTKKLNLYEQVIIK